MIALCLLGQKSIDCPTPLTQPACYEPCEHTGYVLDQMLPFIGNPEYLESLIRGILTTQEQFIEALCNYTPDICKIGEILGFPCVQCGFVVQPIFDLCPSSTISCTDQSYKTIDPCRSLCAPLCTDVCITSDFDFSTSGESQVLYATIVSALMTFSGGANWSGIEAMAKAIFGIDAAVVAFQNGTYYLDIGRVMTEFEMSAINIIKTVFPVPIGSTLQFIERVC